MNLELEFLIYRSLRGYEETGVMSRGNLVWFTEKAAASFYEIDVTEAAGFLKEMYKEGIICGDEVIGVVQKESAAARGLSLYRLSAVIKLGFKLNSYKVVEFRGLSTSLVEEIILRGVFPDTSA